jgi:hypothetical protein
MAGIIESYKKVFENKNANIEIGILIFVWMFLSMLFDNLTGAPNSFKQNIIDDIGGLFLSLYGMQFIHNMFNDGNSTLTFKNLNLKAFGGLLLLNIVWYCYFIFMCLAVAIIVFYIFRIPALAYICAFVLALFMVPVVYIFIAYAENFKLKGLFNIKIIGEIFKPVFKQTFKNFFLCVLITIGLILGFLLITMILNTLGISNFMQFGKDFSILDWLTASCFAFLVITTWLFAYPYSLKETYIEKVKPLLLDKYNLE